jgi:hypothetical protein
MHRCLSVRQIFLAILLLAGPAILAAATWPNLLNYQGQLTDPSGNAVADGSYNVKFAIYPAATPGPTPVWTETQTVTVSKGLFNAVLGSTTGPGLSTLTPAQLNNDLWLGITVGADPEMTPRQQLLGPLNANNAEYLAGLQPNNAANNLVVLDGTGKIPAGLIQGGSIQFPLAMSGSSSYGLSVVNSNSASSAVGLSVVASSGIQGFATDPAGSGVAGFSGSSTGYALSGTNTSATGVGVEGLGFIGVQGGVTQAGSGFGVQGIVSGTSSSNAIAVSGINYIPGGTGISGRALGGGAGTGVRGSSLSGSGAIGVLGTVTGTSTVGVVGNNGTSGGIGAEGYAAAAGSQGVEGYAAGSGSTGTAGVANAANSVGTLGIASSAASTGVLGVAQSADSTGVTGLQANPGATGQAAGVHGTTNGTATGIGVLGDGNQGVAGNSSGFCGVCAANVNPSSGVGLNATSPNIAINATSSATAIQAASNGTSALGLGVNASVASTVANSAAGQFTANGTSGQTFGLNVINNSATGTGIQSVGGIQAVDARAVAGGTNFNSDGTNSPAFGFQHVDIGTPSGAVGVYSQYTNCTTCYGGEFINLAATQGSGSALLVQGRLTVQQSAGTFLALTGAASVNVGNFYVTPNSLVFLTSATPGNSAVASVYPITTNSFTVNFTPPLTQSVTYNYLIIGQ